MARTKRHETNGLARIGVAIDADLLARFDAWCAANGRGNRSEAFRDLIRERLVEAEMDERVEVVAAVSLVYDHHRRELSRRLIHLQHEEGHHVVSSMHVHLDHDRCLEVIVLRARARDARAFAERLLAEKGVEHGGVFLTRRIHPAPSAGALARGHAHGGTAPHRH
ncbi:MAG: nickel-responsive transcriptional regulator NikR [Deltaproteobacteria bacterium]|nr:nickel-responsive transcriptional regulator NikR [Deltaproteobacteria bacterium]